jgi:hypothetical protein
VLNTKQQDDYELLLKKDVREHNHGLLQLLGSLKTLRISAAAFKTSLATHNPIQDILGRKHTSVYMERSSRGPHNNVYII